PAASASPPARRPDAYLALDALLALEELAGFALSNRPARDPGPPAAAVLVADRYPARGDPVDDVARPFTSRRVEATRRPEVIDQVVARQARVNYREDDGVAARATALAGLIVRHPVRCALDVLARERGEPRLSALAPAVLRLARDPGARVHALGEGEAPATARRLAALAGTALAGTAIEGGGS
ncbi:MAG TPA: hypothetical protein VIJ20_12495, partial [Solirubrobacteraceae bacterium]